MTGKAKGTTQRNPDLTRRVLLEAAFEEIHRSGFQAASLDKILTKARVTKGALYHHFGSKRELGYAVVEELIREAILERWVSPLNRAKDPIECLLSILSEEPEAVGGHLGCPLNNLSQEMSAIDEGFRTRLENVFREWRQAIVGALRTGQARGFVRPSVDPDESASFFLAALEGALSLAKNAPGKEWSLDCKAGLATYLKTLRPSRTKPF